jgi:phosphopantothenoylcysteine decarboxylase / phosphopantothenate---cysteine ligase
VTSAAAAGPPDVLLCVSGGIAVYRACELVRLLVRRGLVVQVAMTPTALRFVGEATFAALSRRAVLADRPDVRAPLYPHLEAARAARVVVVAPATANTLAKLAAGLADNVVTESALAAAGPLLVAPAMNVRMWRHPATRDAVARLVERGATIVGPDTGELAEGEVGEGRLAQPSVIAAAIAELAGLGSDTAPAAPEPSLLAGLRIVVTAGGTREPLDPVRFLGNRSSGRMGVAIADAAALRGADVVTVLAAGASVAPGVGRTVRVETSRDLGAALAEEAGEADVVVMAAAVSDYRPRSVEPGKRRRLEGAWTVELEPTEDLLAALAARRREAGDSTQVLVGFAAETSDLAANAAAKLDRKGVDLIVANDVARSDIGFESADNEVLLVSGDGVSTVERSPKNEIADRILDEVERIVAARARAAQRPPVR